MAASREGEGEGRYANLLQPSRDLAANWSVDVAQELDEYLSQLHLTPLFQDGHSCLNFAEAALLIQGSIQVYSKKVEYLYTLVLHALEFITQRKQNQQEKSTTQENGKDPDIEEEKEEEFLNLDDVPEEANIDLNDDEANGIPPPLTKAPASLLVVEGDAFDLVKNAGELATYQIATSYLHRDFLLLDPCDAEAVDKYLNIPRAERVTPRPPSSIRSRIQRGSTPGRRASSTKKSQAADPIFDGFPDGVPDDDDGGSTSEPRNIDFDAPFMNNNDNHERPAKEQQADDEDDDPWKLLNPHEPGTLPIKPFKKGQLSRKIKKARDPFSTECEVEFPLATRNGTTFPEFLEALQAKEAADRLKRNNTAPHLRSKQMKNNFRTPEVPAQEQPDDDEPDNVPWDSDIPETGPEMDIPAGPSNAPDHRKATEEPFENLCHAKRDSVMQSLVEAELRAELATRVSNWKIKIEKSLEVQDGRAPFDIHVYGERIIEKCMHEAPKEEDGVSTFTQLVKGQESHDVARSFAALLQLVNNGNVLIEQDSGGDEGCFTAHSSFKVKLLSCQKAHEDMLHYQAPSHAARTKNKRQPEKGSPKTKLKVFTTGVENMTSKATPDNKRRCKRTPLAKLNR